MIRLLFLLIGAPALKPAWKILTAAGSLWLFAGIAILFDLSDERLSVVLDTLAFFLLIEGFVELAVAISAGIRRHWVDALRGAAFLADGILRIGSSFVVHSPRWRVGITYGLSEICLAAIILASWPLHYRLTVPFCS